MCLCICDSLYLSICRPPTTHAERLSGQHGAFAASHVGQVSELEQDGSSIGWEGRSVLMWTLSTRISAGAVALVCQVIIVLVVVVMMMVVVMVVKQLLQLLLKLTIELPIFSDEYEGVFIKISIVKTFYKLIDC